jgi:hypothetical protein
VCSNSRSLLVLSCSQRKRPDPNLLPAIERYDGPTFRVLRRFLKEQPLAPLDIFILSAKFGFIPHNQPIPNYDQRMTRLRAQELQPHVIVELRDILSSQPYQKLCICMGKDYLWALDGYDILVPSTMPIKVVNGSQGKILADLHSWLYGKSPSLRQRLQTKVSNGKVHIRGIEVGMTPAQVLEKARLALKERQGDPTSYHSWYVLVDGQRVAPKWVVSQLTGLPASSFHTEEARRLLQQLGIQVCMV